MNSVIIVAAGSGKRMNAGMNKQFIKLNEKEIIAHTIDAFYENKNIDEIIVCIKKEEEEFFNKEILKKYNFENIKIAYGGKERQDSIYNGLKNLDTKCEIVLIHDGARPFVNDGIINESIEVAKEKKAVVVGTPVKDTIKVVNNGNVKDTPRRESLWAAQTPQTFDYKLIKNAYDEAYKNDYYGTDDSMLVEYIGQEVTMIMGSYENIKITSPEDINIGEKILASKNKK
ncbi:MAG: 2-C-methyl-D-erythritol 4-phosphate cytidylyltransferase [Peptostreptococcaceae bacterium]